MRIRQHVIPATLLAVILASTSAIAVAAGPASAFKGHELAKEAKVSIAKASELALTARKGAITDEELEHESGGSGLRYTFDIKQGKVMYEVGVDAVTGEILENQTEGADGD